MSEQIESQVISRRKLFLLVGLAASFAVPAAVLTALYGAFEVKQLFHGILHFLHFSFFVRLNPVSLPRPAGLQSRRAQELSRLAVARTSRRTPALPGHTLTASSTTARLMRSGRRSEGSLPSGADHRATTLYSVGP